MEKIAEKKLAAGLSFMGRPLGELLELKASCRKRLEYLEANRGRISEYVFNKLRQEYIVYLDAVDGEVALGLSEYEIKLAEIRLFANQLKLLEKSYREKLEELSLRHSLGEFDQARYESLCAEHEAKMQRFAGSLEKYQGQKKQIEAFLAQARIERSLLDDEPQVAAVCPAPAPEPVAQREPEQPPAETTGPPRSSLLDVESTFTEAEEEQTAAIPVQQPAAAGPAVDDKISETATALLADLPGLSGQLEAESVPDAEEPVALEAVLPEEPVQEEPAVVDALDEELPELPAAAPLQAAPQQPEPAPLETSAAGSLKDDLLELPAMQEIPEPEVAAKDASAGFVPWEQPTPAAKIEPKPEVRPVTHAALSVEEKLPVDELPPWERQPSAPRQSIDDELPEQPGPAETSAETPAQTHGDSGIDLESIFGQAEQTEEVKRAGEDLNWEETPRTKASSKPEAPEPVLAEELPAATPVQKSLEDSLLDDLSGPAPAPKPETSGSTSGQAEGGLDLDDILDQSGAAAPQPKAQPAPAPEPVAWQPEQEQSEEHKQVDRAISDLERDLDMELERAAKAAPAQQTPRTINPPPAADEPEAGPEEDNNTMSLVTLALQRAHKDKEVVPEPEKKDVIEFDLTGADGEADMEVRLTMNQTIDAIKKKTVKCPECGTMNYAIRWYCENCEATLTAL